MKDTWPRVLFPLKSHFYSPGIATRFKAKFESLLSSQYSFSHYCPVAQHLNYKQTNYQNQILYFRCLLRPLKLVTFPKLTSNDKE